MPLLRRLSCQSADFNEATPIELADLVVNEIGNHVDYSDIPVDGAKKAARIIGDMLGV